MSDFAPSLKRMVVSPTHTGSQELVYKAIAAGHKLVGEIMEKTGLEETTVRTSIQRLRDDGRVGRERASGERLVSYFARGSKCLLSEYW